MVESKRRKEGWLIILSSFTRTHVIDGHVEIRLRGRDILRFEKKCNPSNVCQNVKSKLCGKNVEKCMLINFEKRYIGTEAV